jgi:hypothetical protein
MEKNIKNDKARYEFKDLKIYIYIHTYMLFWQSINYFASILGVVSSFLILINNLKRYRQIRFTSLLMTGLGIFFAGLSYSVDIVFRFIYPINETAMFIYLRIFVLIFYPSSLIALFSIFIVQPHVPWLRLLIYALVFGMVIELHLSSDYYIIFKPEYGVWLTHFKNESWANMLNFISAFPLIDLLIYVIRRHRLGYISKPARISVLLFWIGLFFPSLLLVIPIQNEFISESLANLSFMTGLFCISLAFMTEPVVFIFSETKYSEIIIVAPKEGDIPIGNYAWIKTDNQVLKSQALSAINSILDEIVQENPQDRNNIQQIDIGRKKVIIERSPHFIAYLFANAVDLAMKIGLRRVLVRLENNAQTQARQPHTFLPESEFKSLLLGAFSFAILANCIQ